MGAAKGNQNPRRLKTPEARKAAYSAFCDWLAMGKTPNSFYFELNGVYICGKTMLKYIEEFPDEFDLSIRDFSIAKGMAYWEGVVDDSARGDNQKASTASLNMLMRNKYDWDRPEQQSNNMKSPNVEFGLAEAKELV